MAEFTTIPGLQRVASRLRCARETFGRIDTMMRRLFINWLLAAFTGLFAAPLAAQTPEEFYAKKQIRMLVGFGPGTGNDLYMRVLARHLGQHIPGHPVIVPENMPGAASLGMINYLYNAAARDGSVIGMPSRNLLVEPLFGNPQARFKASELSWLGSMSRDTALCFTWHTSGIRTLDDAKRQDVLVGSTGQASNSFFFPRLLNTLFGTRFKPIIGYPDSGAIGIAMERGELQGYCSFTLAAIRSARPQWLADREINVLVQMTLRPNPDLPNIPAVTDLIGNPADARLLALVLADQEMGRPLAGPPGMPVERVQALRAALDGVVSDADFLADARKSGVDVDGPIGGEAVAKIVNELYATPREIVERVKALREGS
jgi:tripartite-type tricarboxylate transporter receptor subunit TctC